MSTPSAGSTVWSLEFNFGEIHEILPNGSFVVWFKDKENCTVHIETYNSKWERIIYGIKTNQTLFSSPKNIQP